MSILYSDLDLKINDSIKTIEINGKEVEVKQYLPVDIKANIIELATSGSVVNGCINEVLMDAYLHTFIIENYTNIKFSEEQIDDIFKIFDELNSSGALNTIIQAMNSAEYNFIFDVAERAKNTLNQYNQSYAKGMNSLANLNQTQTS